MVKGKFVRCKRRFRYDVNFSGSAGVVSKRIAVIQEGRYLLERMLKMSNAGAENRWIESEEKPCVMCVKVMVQGK